MSQSLCDITKAAGIDVCWASKILRLAQLAPAVIEAAMGQGQLNTGVSELLNWFPDEWEAQRERLVP